MKAALDRPQYAHFCLNRPLIPLRLLPFIWESNLLSAHLLNGWVGSMYVCVSQVAGMQV